MENLKKYLFNFLFFSFLFFFIYNLTIIYSEYYSDLHHWGFIASTSLDYINGRLLFKEVLVHYGAGQLIFFDFISLFLFPIFFSGGGLGGCSPIRMKSFILSFHGISSSGLSYYFGGFSYLTWYLGGNGGSSSLREVNTYL